MACPVLAAFRHFVVLLVLLLALPASLFAAGDARSDASHTSIPGATFPGETALGIRSASDDDPAAQMQRSLETNLGGRVRVRLNGRRPLAAAPGKARVALPASRQDEAWLDVRPLDEPMELKIGRQDMHLAMDNELLAGVTQQAGNLDGMSIEAGKADAPLRLRALAARLDGGTGPTAFSGDAALSGAEADLALSSLPGAYSLYLYRQTLGETAEGRLDLPGAPGALSASTVGGNALFLVSDRLDLLVSAARQSGGAADRTLDAQALAAGLRLRTGLPLASCIELALSRYSGGTPGQSIGAFQPLAPGDASEGLMGGRLTGSNLRALRLGLSGDGPWDISWEAEALAFTADDDLAPIYGADGAALDAPEGGVLGHELRLGLELPIEDRLSLDATAGWSAPSAGLREALGPDDPSGLTVQLGVRMDL